MKKSIERRRTQRLNIPLKVQYRLSSKKKALIEKVFTNNVSGGGVGLLLDKPIEIGVKLKTFIHFPNDAKPVASTSEVVWCERKTKKSFAVGIRHLKIAAKDKERFVFLFCEMMINYFLVPGEISIYGNKSK